MKMKRYGDKWIEKKMKTEKAAIVTELATAYKNQQALFERLAAAERELEEKCRCGRPAFKMGICQICGKGAG